MATLRIRAFARYAELLGDPIELDVELPITLSSLSDLLRRLPHGRLLPAQLLIAVNHHIVPPDHWIGGTEEIALLPPLAGG